MHSIDIHDSSVSNSVALAPVYLEREAGAPCVDSLWLPFRAGRHSDTDSLEAENLAWLRAYGLLGDENLDVFRRARFHDLAGRVYHTFDRAALRLCADFIAALFVLDDLMDTDSSAICRDAAQAAMALDIVRASARSGLPPASASGIGGIAAAMADLTRRIAERGGLLDAYLAELDAYFDGVIEEARMRGRSFAGVDDYASARVSFSAVYACIELGLALIGQRMPIDMRPLARAANLSVSWVNDLFSWPKERHLGEPSNLILVLMRAERSSEASAFHAACRACDGVVADYLRESRARVSRAGPAVALLESWMRGNYDWHAEGTARYRCHLSVAPNVSGLRATTLGRTSPSV